MSFLVSVIPTLIVLGILILIHEYGHFLACRLSGVKVEKFSIGFGPEIFHWQGKETRYALSLFPLGGFVKPAGESVSEVSGDQGPQPGDYLAAPLISRIFIVCAGVLMNYLLAFVLFTAIFMIGRPIPGTTIGDFVAGFPAEKSGLQAGDRIVEVNGNEVQTWVELTTAFDKAPEGEIFLSIDRSGQPMNFTVQPKVEQIKDIWGKPATLKRLGITPHPAAMKYEKFGFFQAVVEAAKVEFFYTAMTYKAIFHLFMGKMSLKAMAGPIGIIAMTGDAAKLGLPYVLQMMATLSISLAVINLLPIPALDGGHLLFLLIEAVQRKKMDLNVQEKATQVGFVMLLMLMGFILYNDVMNFDVFTKIRALF